MGKIRSSAKHTRQYRERLRASGEGEVLVKLPRETIAAIDEFKQREGLRNRSQAMLQLIEQGRQTVQKTA